MEIDFAWVPSSIDSDSRPYQPRRFRSDNYFVEKGQPAAAIVDRDRPATGIRPPPATPTRPQVG